MKRTLVALTVLALAAGCGSSGEGEDTKAGDSGEKPAVVQKPSKDYLLEPESEEMNRTAPDLFKVVLETTKGEIVIEVHRDWSPHGADRFYNLVSNGYYDEVRFFRVVTGFMAQFGMHGDPRIGRLWADANFPDDSVKESNLRGYVTYAKSGAPNSRSTQIFINYGDNSSLDAQGFSPFGKVVTGMEAVDSLHSGYGDGPPRGRGPSQGRIRSEGNSYLQMDFPKLDYIKKARVLQ